MRQARGGVLVVGGGFAGGYVARLLGERGATIVSPENFMLYTPMLPEAASGTLEPRHTVVPLRQMCPRAELVLGRVTEIDEERRVGPRRDDPTPGTFDIGWDHLVLALGAVPRVFPVPGLAEHGLGFKNLADAITLRNRVLRAARGRGRGARRRARPRATSASSSSAPATPASRRSRSCPTSSTTRCAGTRACAASRSAGCSSTPRRRSWPRSRPASATTRRRSSPAAVSRSTSRRCWSRSTARRPCSRTATGSRRGRSSGRPASRRARCSACSGYRWTSAAGSSVDSFLRVEGRERDLVARRLRRRPERADAGPVRPADLPARAPPGAPAGEEHRSATRSRTATGCSARWRRSGATRGSPT